MADAKDVRIVGLETALAELVDKVRARTVPPTAGEIDHHCRNGGQWLVSFDSRCGGPWAKAVGAREAMHWASVQRQEPLTRVFLWRPIDHDGNPVRWPLSTVELRDRG